MYNYVWESQIIHNQKQDNVLYIYTCNNDSAQPQAHVMIKCDILKTFPKNVRLLQLYEILNRVKCTYQSLNFIIKISYESNKNLILSIDYVRTCARNKTPSMNQIRHSARKSTSKCKIDEVTNLLESDTQNNTCDEEQYHPIFYELPPGKKYHLYISHSDEDETQALKIGRDLESRFFFRCMISGRDFLPGTWICDNIHHEMLKSVNVLLILTPSFLKSLWCDVEARLAVQMSYDPNFNLQIIPLKLRDLGADSDLPPFLKPFECIDAQRESDIPARLNNALYHIGRISAFMSCFGGNGKIF